MQLQKEEDEVHTERFIVLNCSVRRMMSLRCDLSITCALLSLAHTCEADTQV